MFTSNNNQESDGQEDISDHEWEIRTGPLFIQIIDARHSDTMFDIFPSSQTILSSRLQLHT
ncbi:hypothetical protein BV22DRAFT_1036779 [Leucogyrophana mollusca]|uniref:Uncharacterized protein n=1 Tax=Leucogyrophana mollusca TaxID=85980 RepID=A0ACB8BCP4_9AGAM|nr:hypothetical protein BV22DRAFT_1036779 [Leucogyrophana mollusca]